MYTYINYYIEFFNNCSVFLGCIPTLSSESSVHENILAFLPLN